MGEITKYLTPIVKGIVTREFGLLPKPKDKTELGRANNRALYIAEELYEISSVTEVNRVYSTTSPSDDVDVTEKVQVTMESSKGGAKRYNYLPVNG